MAVIVIGEITITKGFDHWKSMVFSQKEKMAGMGMQFLFAGTEMNDPTKLHTVIKFESVEALGLDSYSYSIEVIIDTATCPVER